MNLQLASKYVSQASGQLPQSNLHRPYDTGTIPLVQVDKSIKLPYFKQATNYEHLITQQAGDEEFTPGS